MTEHPNEDDAKDAAWARRHGVLYSAAMSTLYHQKRERFFELWDKLSKVAALLGGSAALYKAADANVVSGIAIAITVMSAMSLVFGFSERSRRHAELSRQFKKLAATIVHKGPIDFSDADINNWDNERYQLEATEPPALSLLVVMCQNEIAVAENQPNKVVRIGFIKRLFANFLDIPAPITKTL